MSARSKLPELPKGAMVFCSSRDLTNYELRQNSKHPQPYPEELASPKKGVCGIVRIDEELIQCVAYLGGWRMIHEPLRERVPALKGVCTD